MYRQCVIIFVICIVPPINVAVVAVGSTWITLSWEQIITSAGISLQLVIVSGGPHLYNKTVDGMKAASNITGLHSGVMYTLQVISVAEDGQMSFPSVSAAAMTQLPCKYISYIYISVFV